MMRRNFWLLAAALCALVAVSCATKVAPSGGPEDKLPPRVAAVYPPPNSTNVPEELYVKLVFDEWINASVPRSAVNISPPLEKRLKFEVSGDELEITSRAMLDSGTTYTLTVAGALKDLHGNAIASPFQLSFSTGSVIDSLKLAGHVMVTPEMFKSKERIYPSVGLYPIGAERERRSYLKKYRDSTFVGPDTTPQLTVEIPLYVTQADSTGAFELIGLHPGTYKMLAFQDVNGNRRVELSDEVAGYYGDVTVGEVNDSVWIPVADHDTSLVELDSAYQQGKSVVIAKFSRQIVLDSLGSCFLRSGRDTLFAARAFTAEPMNLPAFYFAEAPEEDSTYTFQCLYAIDSSGRALDTARAEFEFTWVDASADTLPPKIIKVLPKKDERGVFPNTEIILSYNKPNLADTLENDFRIVIRKDTLPVKVTRIDLASFSVLPLEPWPTDARIALLQMYYDTTLALPDSTGFRDTIVETKYETITLFESVKKLQMAELSGKIPGGGSSTKVRVRSVETGEIFEERCGTDGSFKMAKLLAGKYIVDYYEADEHGKLDAGSLSPLREARPWRVSLDTLVLGGGQSVLEDLVALPSLN